MKKLIKGVVEKGHGVGRRLGFPTVNLKGFFDLDYGVYACVCLVGERKLVGALHYGPRRTFDEGKESMEVHLLDFKGDLYGKKIEIEVYNKIRDVKKFDSEEALKRAIAEDVEVIGKLKLI